MTSEVCLMNRLAVVLAADSASTVTRWSEEGKEERYFKGANKIFQISNTAPVGMMIFDSAEILRVPWEVVVKAFRKQLGVKTFNDVKGYAEEFFRFLNESTAFFPAAIQQDALLNTARSSSLSMLMKALPKDGSEDERRAATNAFAPQALRNLQDKPYHPCLAAIAEQILVDEVPPLVALLEEWREDLGNDYPDDVGPLAQLGLKLILQAPQDHLGTTGLVFAGYGDHDVFPTMVEYRSSSIVNNCHIHDELSKGTIDHDTPASLSAFAQTSMSDTFSLGLSEEAYSAFMVAVDEGLTDFGADLMTAAGVEPGAVADPHA